jgi:hypothetical protein
MENEPDLRKFIQRKQEKMASEKIKEAILAEAMAV